MRHLVSGKVLRRLAAASVGIFVLGLAISPAAAPPARGDGTTSIAVNSFENEAGAPPNVVSDLTNAAYRAVSSSGRFTPKGAGPLPAQQSLTSDAFVAALDAAAKAGAEDVLLGSVIQAGGGQVYYRLSLYRVAPTAFIASQVFSQAYPAADANSLSAGIASNLATLAAPRQAVGTIWSTEGGPKSDTGSSDGFQLGDRFNVMRGGQKMAEATIASIQEDEASLTISNAVGGYTPMVGDALIGLRPLAPALPAPPEHSTFSALGFLAAVGGALLAIGHHGQPGSPCVSCVAPSPSAGTFSILDFIQNGHPPTGSLEFDFSAVVNTTSQTGIQGDTNYASFVMQPPGSNATTAPAPLSQLGTVTFTLDPTGTMSILTVTEQNGLVGGQFEVNFSSLIQDVNGDFLIPSTTGLKPFSLIGHSSATKPRVGPVAPGPKPHGTAKPLPPLPGPKPPPNPNDPKTPH